MEEQSQLQTVDFHPNPSTALVDGPQALTMDELDFFVEDIQIARNAYLERKKLAGGWDQ